MSWPGRALLLACITLASSNTASSSSSSKARLSKLLPSVRQPAAMEAAVQVIESSPLRQARRSWSVSALLLIYFTQTVD